MGKLWKRIVSWFALALATVILWMPIYYFVIGAFKKRTDIVKHPLAIDFSRMSCCTMSSAMWSAADLPRRSARAMRSRCWL